MIERFLPLLTLENPILIRVGAKYNHSRTSIRAERYALLVQQLVPMLSATRTSFDIK